MGDAKQARIARYLLILALRGHNVDQHIRVSILNSV
jgi:hypothetical protein